MGASSSQTPGVLVTRALAVVVTITAIVAFPMPASAQLICQGKDATIIGTELADVLVGTDGDDVIVGDRGDDRLSGRGGNDTICGGGGHDRVTGGAGNDTLVGGSHRDMVLYSFSSGPVVVDLGSGTASGDGNDFLEDFEDVKSSRFDDEVSGDEFGNELYGGAGDDVIDGREGADFIVGGIWQRESRHTWACEPSSGADSLVGGLDDDSLWGCDGDDTIAGEAGNDYLLGGAIFADFFFNPCVEQESGNDSLSGGDGADELLGCDGDDLLDGGADRDMASFSFAETDVTAELSLGTAVGDGTDSLVAIEDLTGSDFDDLLIGNEQENLLIGGRLHTEGSSDQFVYGYGDDVLEGMGGADALRGGIGSDSYEGGDGDDTLLLSTDLAGYGSISVDLSTGRIEGEGIDTESGMENIVTTAERAVLFGDESANRLDGGWMRSVIDGRAGDDIILGRSGDDRLLGRAGDDYLAGGGGDDELLGGPGNDECVKGERLVGCEHVGRLQKTLPARDSIGWKAEVEVPDLTEATGSTGIRER